MNLIIVALLLFTAIYLVLVQFKTEIFGVDDTHLPEHLFDENQPQAQTSKDRYSQEVFKPWIPLTAKYKDLEKRIPLPLGGLKRKLIRAGSPMGVLEFLAFKALSLLSVASLSVMFLGDKFSKDIQILLAVALFVGYMIPEFWLNGKIKKRLHNIRRDLPNIIDLLNLCVSGGMDFMLAVNRVVRDIKPCDLTRELGEVYRETQIGKTRREALKNFAWRVDMPEVHSFVRTLVQADRMGTPMAEAMNLQAEEMRVRRFQFGESMALKAPIKLLFPLFAFILPVVMIIVGGPIILQFVRGGLNLGF
jgi:tight adherence protein C